MNDSGEQEGSSAPRAVWKRFAEDNEEAIRLSAPREPSAFERSTRPSDCVESGEGAALASGPAQWVGENYDATQGQQAWRDMSGRDRWRYLAEALVVMIVMTAVLLVVSRASPVPDTSDTGPGDVVLQETERAADGLPTQ
ncbi:hypothetical protein [Streptomyces sp. RTGN2]|uniref:hypothetical protein n=1 Tax=Streptomyces sp. RTGN2 TaxID=3016525 RepID=UPI002556006B|nr:hypothetical protein [Streptomyces sp. RTGN2]